MELKDKIKEIRKNRKLNLMALHRKLKEVFGKNAVSYRTLLRIENGDTDGRGSSLYQICVGLGITMRELKSETEKKYEIADFLKKNDYKGRYIYNEKAYMQILTSSNIKFLCVELYLKPKSTTKPEKDPSGDKKYEKWIYMLRGQIVCVIDQNEYVLRCGDSLIFDSTKLHHYENRGRQNVKCIIVQNPRNI